MQQSTQQTTSNRINMTLRGLLLTATAVLGLGSAIALAQDT